MITDVAVVVPAADEQDEIAGCLHSIEIAALALVGVRAHVIVVLDSCTDSTAAVVSGFAGVHTVVSDARCVGTARRVGSDHAIARFGGAGLWLANTDADCRVPKDWLARLAEHAGSGAELVLGTVRPRPGLPAHVADSWQLAHDLSDGHPHVHGANLAVAAAAYERIGGWHDLPAHEDVDLVNRAVASGCRITRTGTAPVVTSSRLRGRTPEGFAAHLRALCDAHAAASVDRAT